MAVWLGGVYRRPMRLLARVVTVAVLATTLGACGDDEVCSPPDGDACFPDPDPSGDGGADRNEADEVFVQVAAGSIGTLRQIVALAEEQSGSAEVADLGEEIDEALGEVREQLEAWEDDWDLPEEIYGAVPELPQQEQSEDWQRLEELDGEEFDDLWVNVVAESLAAVQGSADAVVERGEDAEVRELAEDLVNDCAGWIDELEGLRD